MPFIRNEVTQYKYQVNRCWGKFKQNSLFVRPSVIVLDDVSDGTNLRACCMLSSMTSRQWASFMLLTVTVLDIAYPMPLSLFQMSAIKWILYVVSYHNASSAAWKYQSHGNKVWIQCAEHFNNFKSAFNFTKQRLCENMQIPTFDIRRYIPWSIYSTNNVCDKLLWYPTNIQQMKTIKWHYNTSITVQLKIMHLYCDVASALCAFCCYTIRHIAVNDTPLHIRYKGQWR